MVLGNLLVDIFELLVVLAAQGNDALIGNVLCIQLRAVDRDGLEGRSSSASAATFKMAVAGAILA